MCCLHAIIDYSYCAILKLGRIHICTSPIDHLFQSWWVVSKLQSLHIHLLCKRRALPVGRTDNCWWVEYSVYVTYLIFPWQNSVYSMEKSPNDFVPAPDRHNVVLPTSCLALRFILSFSLFLSNRTAWYTRHTHQVGRLATHEHGRKVICVRPAYPCLSMAAAAPTISTQSAPNQRDMTHTTSHPCHRPVR